MIAADTRLRSEPGDVRRGGSGLGAGSTNRPTTAARVSATTSTGRASTAPTRSSRTAAPLGRVTPISAHDSAPGPDHEQPDDPDVGEHRDRQLDGGGGRRAGIEAERRQRREDRDGRDDRDRERRRGTRGPATGRGRRAPSGGRARRPASPRPTPGRPRARCRPRGTATAAAAPLDARTDTRTTARPMTEPDPADEVEGRDRAALEAERGQARRDRLRRLPDPAPKARSRLRDRARCTPPGRRRLADATRPRRGLVADGGAVGSRRVEVASLRAGSCVEMGA